MPKGELNINAAQSGHSNGASPNGHAKSAQIDTSRNGHRDSDKEKELNTETLEWIESLEWVREHGGNDRVAQLLETLEAHAHKLGVKIPFSANTPYINTIPVSEQPRYPGNLDLEQKIRSILRWNAMAMVVRANKESHGIGGHISTYASCATLYEVAFSHFFRGPNHPDGPDQVYFQGHSSPGVYSRAFLEGHFDEGHLRNFRQDLRDEPGLTSYPHPWLMPDFWEFPTVSMGLGPIMSIYQARFKRYLSDRGLKDLTKSKVWAFV
ncbi:MAG: hypothetical protein ABI210_06490, partial [Abditibacteriaceae bacterium]